MLRVSPTEWLRNSSSGYCDATDYGPNECESASKGRWELDDTAAASMPLAVAACLERCASCRAKQHLPRFPLSVASR